LRRDVVDHEMFGVVGDVNKMILGSFEPDYDNLDSDTDSVSLMNSEKSSKSSKTTVPDTQCTNMPFIADYNGSSAVSDSRNAVRSRAAGRSDNRRRSIIMDKLGKIRGADPG